MATKNVKIAVNFSSPVWCESPDIEGYLPIQEAELEHKSRAPKPPESIADCEVLMLVGLPASGKSTWALRHCNQNKDKRYTILGNDTLQAHAHARTHARTQEYIGYTRIYHNMPNLWG